MNYKIIADSCCDLDAENKKNMNVEIVPLVLRLGDKEYIDDEGLDVSHYMQDMNNCETYPKTACPSPAEFLKKYECNQDIFVVTLSSKLSGTYQSALTARDMYLDKIGNKFIHVFDSMSASAGEAVVVKKINELSSNGLSSSEIVEKVSKYIEEMKTFFLLENMDNLSKSGRLNPVIAKIASILEIKPIMGSNGAGSIKLFEKIRGYRKAFIRLAEIIGEQGADLENKVIGIAHCNCPDKAVKLKEEIQKRYKFKDIVIVKMAGLSSTYADNGGLVIAF